MALVTRASVKYVFFANGSKSSRFLRTYSNLWEWRKQVNELCVARFCQSTAQFSSDQADISKNFIAFNTLVSNRQKEATRTIVVGVTSKESCKHLYNYCSEFGKIKEMHHYTTKNSNNFIMVEFYNVSAVEEIVTFASHKDMEQRIPVKTSMFSFQTNKKNSTINPARNSQFLTVTNACQIPTKSIITSVLLKADSVSDQMLKLHKMLKLSDTCMRLRFHTAYQIQSSFSGLFPKMSVLPFGSTMNGFGKRGCDLDVAIILNPSQPNNLNNQLVYNTKEVIGYSCSGTQVMECIASTLHLVIPGAVNVRRIFTASVPIIKFKQIITNVDCDVSTTNPSAVYMSELLYLYGNMDWRVTPLVFTIREWASNNGITKTVAGKFITNFALTLMVIFYMQRANILPSLDDLKNQATSSDVRLTDNYVDCSFLRDLTKLRRPKFKNTASLEQLLLEFFVFLANFDYERHSISIKKGSVVENSKHKPLAIVNPFETNLNVSKNVKLQQVQELKEASARAAEILSRTMKEDKSLRGIIPLISHYEDTGIKSINFADIFNDDDKKKSEEILEKSEETVAAGNSEENEQVKAKNENNLDAEKNPAAQEDSKGESPSTLATLEGNEDRPEAETETITTQQSISRENFDNTANAISKNHGKAKNKKLPDAPYQGSFYRLLVSQQHISEKKGRVKKYRTRAKR